MEDVRDLEFVLLSNVLNLFEHCRQLAERDHTIHAVVIRNAPKSAERGFAALPDRGRLLFALAYAQRHRIESARNFCDSADLILDLAFRAFHFDDQHRLGVHRISSLREGLANLDSGLIHELDRHGDEPIGDDRRNATPCRFGGREADEDRARAFRLAQNAHGHFCHDAELAFGADDKPKQVVALRIEVVAAEFSDLAVHQNHLDFQDVIGCHAILQAMRAA